jgi:hypothetical protein
MTHELEPTETPFWHPDEELGELELKERPNASDGNMVRLKAHTATIPYHAKRELYPLEHDGTEHEVAGKAYILVPDITLTVGLYTDPQPSAAIGQVTDSSWQGMRHYDIANVRGLYYEDDRALAVWEVDPWERLDEFAHGRLWQLFETFLIARFPGAARIFTDDAEPHEQTERNREFLKALGYEHVVGTHRIFKKEVVRP